MTFENISAAQRSAARVAGLTLVLGFSLPVFGEFYLMSGIIADSAAETARNLLDHETRVRLKVVFDLLYVANALVLLPALYIVLRPVNQGLALAAIFMRLVFAVWWGLGSAMNTLGALSLLGNAPYLHALDPDKLQALARLRFHGSFDAYYVGLPFWALASTLCAWLWFRSRYIPRILSGYGLLASTWCVFCAFVYLVFPGFDEVVNAWYFDLPMALFELATGFWLLFKGIAPPPSRTAV